jgi:oligogalacturonide lyase
MHKIILLKTAAVFGAAALSIAPASAQIGHRSPSEKKIVIDPVTGTPLTFLTSSPVGDSKIYQTHPDWTADGKWLIFRSSRARGQAFAVNEETGDIVQVTEGGYMGMLCVSRLSMKLYIMRDVSGDSNRRFAMMPNPTDPLAPQPPPGSQGDRDQAAGAPTPPPGAQAPGDQANGSQVPPMPPAGRFRPPRGPFQIVEVDLASIFADSAAGTMKPESAYDRVCGTTPPGMTADGNMGLDANEDFAYFRVGGPEVAKLLPPDQKPAERFGPRGMGAGPTGLASMNLKTGEVKNIVTVPFQIGHVQTNPWMPGEIVFCWETGGKAPQRTWTVMADGTGLRPLYPEASYEWITHEAVITKDEVAIAILYTHTPLMKGPPQMSAWGPAGTDEHPTGVGIVNLRTHEMRIVGQVPLGNPGRSIWHVNGSADGRWAVADDFRYRLWIIDRHTGEMALLASMGEKTQAADHIHPTFNADGTEIEVQTAMLSPDKPSAPNPGPNANRPRMGAMGGRLPLNICVVPVPKAWLARSYDDKNRLLAP